VPLLFTAQFTKRVFVVVGEWLLVTPLLTVDTTTLSDQAAS